MVYMYHSFLIHSSADGHLGCFHVLAIINSGTMNIGVHVSLSDLVSLVCMPRRGNTCKPMAVSFQCMTKSTTNKKKNKKIKKIKKSNLEFKINK